MYIPRLLAAAGLALMSVPAAAQQVGNFDVTTNETGIESPLLTLSISGSASAKPDLVIIGGGVSTSSTDPGQAMVQNNAVSEKIVAAIRRLGIADKDIQTSSISLGRDYEEEYVDAGTAADGTAEATAIAAGDIRIPGKARRYRAANTVVIRLRDIAMAGKVVNILVENGANNVNGPNFSIEDDTPLLDKARAQALDKAANLSAQYAQKTGFTARRLSQ
ncbi:MAG: SIMPL domain-containing protein [Sphingomonadales bacterium]|nr:SIMPL domain-containing protein [Sphingomonadales bacterium]